MVRDHIADQHDLRPDRGLRLPALLRRGRHRPRPTSSSGASLNGHRGRAQRGAGGGRRNCAPPRRWAPVLATCGGSFVASRYERTRARSSRRRLHFRSCALEHSRERWTFAGLVSLPEDRRSQPSRCCHQGDIVVRRPSSNEAGRQMQLHSQKTWSGTFGAFCQACPAPRLVARSWPSSWAAQLTGPAPALLRHQHRTTLSGALLETPSPAPARRSRRVITRGRSDLAGLNQLGRSLGAVPLLQSARVHTSVRSRDGLRLFRRVFLDGLAYERQPLDEASCARDATPPSVDPSRLRRAHRVALAPLTKSGSSSRTATTSR